MIAFQQQDIWHCVLSFRLSSLLGVENSKVKLLEIWGLGITVTERSKTPDENSNPAASLPIACLVPLTEG